VIKITDNITKEEKIRSKIKHDLEGLSTFEEDNENRESEREKTLRILLDKKDINLKTELSDKEILEIARLQVISERINSNSLALFLSSFKELRVSKNRQGRKEIIGAMQDDDTKDKHGFFDQFVTDLVGKQR